MSAPCESPTPEPPEAVEHSPSRLVAVFPVGWLGEGEVVHLLTRPSAWWIAMAMVPWVVVATLLGVFLGWISLLANWVPWSVEGIWWAALLLVAGATGWKWMQWIAKAYILTDRRVVARGGVIRRFVVEMSVVRLQQTAVTQSVMERVTGCGTLSFASAGTGGYDIVWETLAHSQRVQSTVRSVLETP